MNIYLLNIIVIFISFFICKSIQMKKKINGEQTLGECCSLIIIGLLLFIEMAFRGDFVIDVINYYYIFQSSDRSLLSFFKEDFLQVAENGYTLLNIIVHQLGGDFIHLQIIIAIIISYSYVKFVKKNSDNLWLSFFILFCSGTFYTGFNITRQIMAAALFSLCYVYIEKKEPYKYFLAVVLISMFHASILVMLPLYFFFDINWKNKNIYFVIVIITFVSVFLYVNADAIISFFAIWKYSNYGNDNAFGMNQGVGFLGTLKAILIAVGILLNYGKFDMSNRKEKMVYNGTILYLLFAICASKIFMIYRFIHYFLPCVMMGYPILLQKIENKNKRKWTTVFIVIFLIATCINSIISNNYYFYWDNKTIFY